MRRFYETMIRLKNDTLKSIMKRPFGKTLKDRFNKFETANYGVMILLVSFYAKWNYLILI